MIRPLCIQCNKTPRAINYKRNGITHYRSLCDECGRKKNELKSRVPSWQKAGYKKKATCDLCGFRSSYSSQLTVFHIDGNLENVQYSNLRTVCLNCIEVIKRKDLTWRRGGLDVDY